MPEKFQKRYSAEILPQLLNSVEDPVPRVQSHACAALTNFMEGYKSTLNDEQIKVICQKLLNLVQNGISLVKENAVTALATVVEQVKEAFNPYYKETTNILLTALANHQTKEYKQFRGQVIEAITIMSAAVSDAMFMEVADQVVHSMLAIQTQQLEAKDQQRIYLLSAWQRICLIMKGQFAKYLP